MVLEWIFFAIAFAISSIPVVAGIDPIGLTMSIISMILIIAAINRDYFFKQKNMNDLIVAEVK
jgi:hypothetical protein